MIIDKVKNFLAQAQSLKGYERHILIKKVCDLIWDDNSMRDSDLNDLLTDIGYILEDYEPNVTWRKASQSYYGDERLEQEIKSALQKLEKYSDAK